MLKVDQKCFVKQFLRNQTLIKLKNIMMDL
jgi:hypothetical protein